MKTFMQRDNQLITTHERIGETNKNSYNTFMQINGYNNCDHIDVMMVNFLSNGFVKYYQKRNVKYTNFLLGAIKSPYDKSIADIGFIGEGKFDPSSHHRIYNIWKHMLVRCNEKYNAIRPSYKDVSVDIYFHSFQNFCEWYLSNFYSFNNERMDLDKDILKKGNKIYGPNTCCFVPSTINTLFTKNNASRGSLPIGVQYYDNNRYIAKVSIDGIQKIIGDFSTINQAFNAYKEAKEKEIKRVANHYLYNKGGINIPQYRDIVYPALLQYKVEITD